MSKEQGNKQQKQFDTFRGKSDVHRKTEYLNQTLPTMLDYSNIRSNSPGGLNTSLAIKCPTHGPEDIYKCEVCSKLRLVCPYRGSLSKGKSKAEGETKKTEGLKIQPFSTTLLHNTIPIKTEINESKAQQTHIKKIQIERAQTPQFHSFTDLGVKFADSLPYIKNLEGTDRTNQSHIRIQQNFPKPIKLNPRPASSHQFAHHQRTVPSQHIWQNSPAQSRYVHQQKLPTYMEHRPQTRIIEQIVFVPVIHNVMVPSVVVNPQQSFTVTPRSRQFHVVQGSNSKSSVLQQSPIASRIKQHKYNEKQVMTPENFKKLADSIIR